MGGGGRRNGERWRRLNLAQTRLLILSLSLKYIFGNSLGLALARLGLFSRPLSESPMNLAESQMIVGRLKEQRIWHRHMDSWPAVYKKSPLSLRQLFDLSSLSLPLSE